MRTLPSHQELVDELRYLRQRGLPRLRHCPRDALREVALAAGCCTGPDDELEGIEELLGAAVRRLAGGGPLLDTDGCDPLARAAAHCFGLFAHRRGLPAADRRKAAAAVYGVSTERFRRSQERAAVEELASAMLALAREAGRPKEPDAVATGAPQSAPVPNPPLPAPPPTTAPPRWVAERITVLLSPIELVRDVDILVSSENIYLEMSKTFRPTVSGALRRAAAVRNPSGEIVGDVLARELALWLRAHGRTGLPVRPGTVVATSAGALSRNGVRRIYHAAVATPTGGDVYHVAPTTVAEAVQASFALAREERTALSLPLSTICFPLLGAGRGGLPTDVAARWLLWAVKEELRRDPSWSVRLATRKPEHAELLKAANSGP
ncbi:macro domain-containing protein [Streptomyces thermovulgaris]|uniref:macro domain-containing protein n=1 Tax=Streptomyces thermovulgaris TaxID=1934 RepID=UPI001FE482EC|nr:macro domain-containing protein [Streptomyces thermovulgaris]